MGFPEITSFINFSTSWVAINSLIASIAPEKTNWINVHGLNDLELVKAVGDYFSIDNFMLADILNTTKRTKLEEHHDVLFFNVKSLLPIENTDNIHVEQISFLLKNGILASFQEKRSKGLRWQDR